VLIASGRMVLEQALDVSQIDGLNQAGSSAWREAIEQLGPGIVLVTARPGALPSWLGLPASLASASPGQTLVASLAPSGAGLVLQARLEGAGTLGVLTDAASDSPGRPLLAALRGNPTSLLLLSDSADLLKGGEGEQPSGEALLGTVLAEALAGLRGPLPALVAQRTPGALLLAAQPGGWLIGTATEQPRPADLQSAWPGPSSRPGRSRATPTSCAPAWPAPAASKRGSPGGAMVWRCSRTSGRLAPPPASGSISLRPWPVRGLRSSGPSRRCRPGPCWPAGSLGSCWVAWPAPP
jgi:hypothetical protein